MNGTYIDGKRIDTTQTIRIRFEAEFVHARKPVELEVTYSQIQAMVVELESAARTLLQETR